MLADGDVKSGGGNSPLCMAGGAQRQVLKATEFSQRHGMLPRSHACPDVLGPNCFRASDNGLAYVTLGDQRNGSNGSGWLSVYRGT